MPITESQLREAIARRLLAAHEQGEDITAAMITETVEALGFDEGRSWPVQQWLFSENILAESDGYASFTRGLTDFGLERLRQIAPARSRDEVFRLAAELLLEADEMPPSTEGGQSLHHRLAVRRALLIKDGPGGAWRDRLTSWLHDEGLVAGPFQKNAAGRVEVSAIDGLTEAGRQLFLSMIQGRSPRPTSPPTDAGTPTRSDTRRSLPPGRRIPSFADDPDRAELARSAVERLVGRLQRLIDSETLDPEQEAALQSWVGVLNSLVRNPTGPDPLILSRSVAQALEIALPHLEDDLQELEHHIVELGTELGDEDPVADGQVLNEILETAAERGIELQAAEPEPDPQDPEEPGFVGTGLDRARSGALSGIEKLAEKGVLLGVPTAALAAITLFTKVDPSIARDVVEVGVAIWQMTH